MLFRSVYPPLSVHSNTVLSPTIAGESLQPIARRDAQILQAPSRVKLLELAHGSPLQPTIERPHILLIPHELSRLVSEGPDHRDIVQQSAC